MLEEVLRQYFSSELAADFSVVDEAEESSDYLMYLVRVGGVLYVVIEVDYLFMDTAIRDVQTNFNVKVEGWMLRQEFQTEEQKLVRADLFRAASPAEGSDEEWDAYPKIAFTSQGWEYFVLQVSPSSRVSKSLSR